MIVVCFARVRSLISILLTTTFGTCSRVPDYIFKVFLHMNLRSIADKDTIQLTVAAATTTTNSVKTVNELNNESLSNGKW